MLIFRFNFEKAVPPSIETLHVKIFQTTDKL